MATMMGRIVATTEGVDKGGMKTARGSADNDVGC
jgi:hypothetical protein